MDLKKLVTRKMLTAYAALATLATAGGCAGTEQWAQQNQGNMALYNTGLNTINTGVGVTTMITDIVQNKDRNDALNSINDTLNKQNQNNNNNRRPHYTPRPQRGGRGR